MRPSSCRWSLPFVALALLVALPAPAHSVERDRTSGPAASRLIPVWAFVNGAAPVAHARVGVTSSGKPVRQVGGRMWKRTNAQGVVVLRVRRVPRRFTVVVRGGRAAGMRVRGRQRRAVTAFRHARVVEVNPLTTLVTRLRLQRPKLNNRRAVRAVKRYFHVPQWADLGQNLRDMGDEWFDAAAYVRDIRRVGSIDRLNRRVARKILMVKSPRARNPRRSPAATASQASWRDMTPGQLVGAGFEYLGANLAGVITQGGITAALGGLLQLAQGAGLIHLPPSEMDLVREQLNAIGKQLTRLEGKVENLAKSLARGNASQLLHQSDEVLALIDDARAQLALLANLAPDDPTRRAFARTIDNDIGAKLRTAPALLNRQLNPVLPIGDNVIKATSRALATERFFDERDSAEVQAVYDHFAMAQLQLTVLLANYWNAHPDTYSEATRKASIAQIQANVLATQKQSLKPPVPSGTFFDTRTPRFMWGTDNLTYTAERVEVGELAKRSIVMLRFSNWQMPSSHDLRNLVDGASGQPRAWLQEQVAVPLRQQLLWASDSVRRYRVKRVWYVNVNIFDLATGRWEHYEYGNNAWRFNCRRESCNDPRLPNPDVKQFLATKTGGLLALRYLAPGESYWW